MYLQGLDGKIGRKIKKLHKVAVLPVRKSTIKKVGKAKIVKKTGKLLKKAAPLIAFIPGVGTAAAAAIKLAATADDLRKQRRAKRAAGQQTAAIDAEIAATEKEIARLQGGGAPPAQGESAAFSAGGDTPGASNAESAPAQTTGNVGKLALGVITALVLLKFII